MSCIFNRRVCSFLVSGLFYFPLQFAQVLLAFIPLDLVQIVKYLVEMGGLCICVFAYIALKVNLVLLSLKNLCLELLWKGDLNVEGKYCYKGCWHSSSPGSF